MAAAPARSECAYKRVRTDRAIGGQFTNLELSTTPTSFGPSAVPVASLASRRIDELGPVTDVACWINEYAPGKYRDDACGITDAGAVRCTDPPRQRALAKLLEGRSAQTFHGNLFTMCVARDDGQVRCVPNMFPRHFAPLAARLPGVDARNGFAATHDVWCGLGPDGIPTCGGTENDWRTTGERLENDWRTTGERLENGWRTVAPRHLADLGLRRAFAMSRCASADGGSLVPFPTTHRDDLSESGREPHPPSRTERDTTAPMTFTARHRWLGIAALCVAQFACGKHASAPAAAAGSGVAAAAAAPANAAAAGDSADPCSLLTTAEASAALGGPAASKVEGSKDATLYPDLKVTEKTCSFALITSDQLGHDIYISVYAAADQNYFSQATGHAPAFAGLGEAAFGDAREVYVFSKGMRDVN